MSTQTTLDEHHQQVPEDESVDIGTSETTSEARRPDWEPNNGASTSGVQCENCDNIVSQQFARVFGDNDGRVWACPGDDGCSSMRKIHEGGAARP